MGANTIEFTDNNFEQEVLKSDVPVLVDFWAEWCGPCRMVGPIIDELATEYQGKVKIGKVDTDKNPETSASYQVSSIPTILLVKNGEVVERIMGARPKAEFEKVLANHV